MEGRASSLHCPRPVSSHLTLPICSISCPWVSLTPTCSAFFSLLSFLLETVACNYLIFPSFCQETHDAEFPGDAHWQGRRSTVCVRPAWSCSHSRREDGAGVIKAGGCQLPANPQVFMAPVRTLKLETSLF